MMVISVAGYTFEKNLEDKPILSEVFSLKTCNNENIEVQDLKRPEEFSVTEIIGLDGNPQVTEHFSFYT